MKKYIFIFVFLFSPQVVFGATYYVATTGNNTTGNGSISLPWQTMAYAESQLSNGDTVIVRGGIYKENITIDTDNVTFQNYTGELPIIDYDYEGPGGKGNYTALIAVCADNVTVDGFEVRESTGTGISVFGVDGDTANNVTIKNCSIHDTWYPAFRILEDADYCTVENCEIYKGSYVMSNCSDPFNPAVCREEGWGDPATIQINNNEYATFKNCSIHDGYNEGFDVDRFSSNTTVEYCEIYGHHKVQLYICSANDITIRYNLIYGLSTNANGQTANGSGIDINNEDNWGLSNISNFFIYGNFVANTDRNFWVSSMYEDGNYYRVSNVTAYNNSFIQSTGDYNVIFNQYVGSGHIFKNNIVWGGSTYAPSDKIIADYNLWSEEPDVDLQGSNDPTYATPSILKTTGWSEIATCSLNYFALQEDSPAIDSGDSSIGSSYDDIMDAEQSSSTFPTSATLLDQDSYGSGWEIGADIYSDSDIISPSHPTNLGVE